MRHVSSAPCCKATTVPSDFRKRKQIRDAAMMITRLRCAVRYASRRHPQATSEKVWRLHEKPCDRFKRSIVNTRLQIRGGNLHMAVAKKPTSKLDNECTLLLSMCHTSSYSRQVSYYRPSVSPTSATSSRHHLLISAPSRAHFPLPLPQRRATKGVKKEASALASSMPAVFRAREQHAK